MTLGSYTTFIQWKGTDICMDFNCPKCGEHTHFDGEFAYAIECSACKAQFKMPDEIGPLLKEIEPGSESCVLREQSDSDEIEGEFTRVSDPALLSSYKLLK